MSRLRLISAAMLIAATAGNGYAQSQAELASKLNEDGKALMYDQKYSEASAKFREAVARVPESKYFFNLCTSLFQEGKFDEAITACNAVSNNNPSAELKAKTDKMVAKIEDEAKVEHIDLHPAGGGGTDPGPGPGDPNQDPNHNPAEPGPTPADPGRAAPPPFRQGRPQGNVVAGVRVDNQYTWTIGLDAFGGGGQIGQQNFYGKVGGGLRFKGDYILIPSARVGVQAYLQVQHFATGANAAVVSDTLDIFDLGIAAYKHLCLPGTERLCLTPLAGVQLALMSPANMNDGAGSQLFNYAAVGGRVELAAAYAFGSRYEHVVSIMVGVNAYSKALSDPSASGGLTAMEVGLDQGGAAGYFGIGYTHRFNTPLGSSPFVTLE